MHSHDIRSLVIWPPFAPLPPSYQHKFPVNIAPILVSGGLDMSVVLTPAAIPSSTTVSKVTNPLGTSVVATFEDSYHRKLGYSTGFSGVGRIRVARNKRLVLSAQDHSINLWRISDRDMDVPNLAEGEVSQEGWCKVLEMNLNVQSNIVSCDISDDGGWVAVSDWYEVKLFRLSFTVSLYLFGAVLPLLNLPQAFRRRECNQNERFCGSPQGLHPCGVRFVRGRDRAQLHTRFTEARRLHIRILHHHLPAPTGREISATTVARIRPSSAEGRSPQPRTTKRRERSK